MTNDPHWHHIAMVSMHTSPLRQPGTGDSGGMNVYIAELASALVDQGHRVDIFTRAAGYDDDPVTELREGLRVVTLAVGPANAVKEELPRYVDTFAEAVSGWAAGHDPRYTVVHSHYWLSAVSGDQLAKRWGIPHVVTMHTLAAVKNARLDPRDRPEPVQRELAEQRILAGADLIIANTPVEARDLARHHSIATDKITVVLPGVDLDRFSPLTEGQKQAVRSSLGIDDQQFLVLFVGRMQGLKAPDVLLEAASELLHRRPDLAEVLRVHFVGGSSGNGPVTVETLEHQARELGLGDVVSFNKAVPRKQLARLYSSADVLTIPSRHESFGLVAIEAAAAGTAVVAAAVGGLQHAVAHDVNGILVPGHNASTWADTLSLVIDDAALRQRLAKAGPLHATGFTWKQAARTTASTYDRAVEATAKEHRNANIPRTSVRSQACTA